METKSSLLKETFLKSCATFLLAGIIVLSPVPSNSQENYYWSDIEEHSISIAESRLIVPQTYRVLSLNLTAFNSYLEQAPSEKVVAVKQSMFIVSLPMPEGGLSRFQVVESPIMAPELAAKFPEIRTFLGQGIDEPTATVRFDVTPAGFHAIIFSERGTVYIDPYAMGNTSYYISYFKRDLMWNEGRMFIEEGPIIYDPKVIEEIQRIITSGTLLTSGNQLRTYRAAIAATGEYTQFHGGTVSAGLSAIVTAMNRINGIYEREVAVRMTLVANNDLVVYTDPATDPYTNSNPSTMLSQNQTNLDNVIGSANYDIGHVFGTAGGGVAYLGVVCVGGWKARGVTGIPSPIGDPFYVDYVAHEIGHQFGANHTFNGNAGSCSGNRNASTAYEPGSGSTIMAYSGICSPQNIQNYSDDYFHGASFDEIIAYTTAGSGSTCPTITSTGNSAPTVNAGVTGLTIPINTPFLLKGSATDPNGDPLRYCWEEFDLGPAGHPNSPSGNAPIFRSFLPTTSSHRTFPKLSDLLNNTQTIGEILPSYGRTLTFRLTARDYRAGGGGVGKATASFTVSGSAGPFLVTSPNTAVTWVAGSVQMITWDVANTNVTPVNCTDVRLLLSTDGGNTWTDTLAANTPNDGSELVTLPNVATTRARVKVESINNIFFDISNVNFTIVRPTITVISPNGGEAWPIGLGNLIRWTSSNVSGDVTIELSRDGGLTYETLFDNTPNDGEELWVATAPPTPSARIRITSISLPFASDVSNANFSIVQPTITVLTPNGGESWGIGAIQNIQWSSSHLTGNVIIELSRNGGASFDTLFDNTPNDGSESWNVIEPVTSEAQIRISSVLFPSVFDVSDSYFSIVQPTITVTVPNGYENWWIGENYTIQWTSNYLTGNVLIELSRDGGTSYETLFTSTPNDGSESWIVTGPATSEAYIRISSVSIPSVSDTSDSSFSIVLFQTATLCGNVYNDINHNQQRDIGEPGMSNVDINISGGIGTVQTNENGTWCVNIFLPGVYTITQSVPNGFVQLCPKIGSIEVQVNSGDNIDLGDVFCNSLSATVEKYRTATYIDWATAKDENDKFKAIKKKPYEVDFKFNITAPKAASGVKILFSMFTNGSIYEGKDGKTNPVGTWENKKEYVHTAPIALGDVFQIDGRGFKGKPIGVKLEWATSPKATKETVTTFKLNAPRLRMPNLHNLGEAIYAQGFVTDQLLLGIPLDIKKKGTVIHPNYKTVMKGLAKGTITHDGGGAKCLDKFDNGKLIKAQLKGLPPDKQKNELYANLLVAKLNILASETGKTPTGFGWLIFDNSKGTGTNPVFNGKTINEIVMQADTALSCASLPQGTTLADFLTVLKLINESFAGPMDTVSFAEKIKLTGVRELKEVPYLRANPAAPVADPIIAEREKYLVPDAFSLYQNYPNPFNPKTTIEFTLSRDAIVSLRVYNVLGQEVATLADNDVFTEGLNEVDFDASSLPSGVYFYRIEVEEISDNEDESVGQKFIAVKKMLLLR